MRCATCVCEAWLLVQWSKENEYEICTCVLCSSYVSFPLFDSYFYIYSPRYSEISPTLDGIIAVDAFQWLSTCPTPGHVAAQVESNIFPTHLRYSTLLCIVPPDRTVTTSSIALHTLLPNFQHVRVFSRWDEKVIQLMWVWDDLDARRAGI